MQFFDPRATKIGHHFLLLNAEQELIDQLLADLVPKYDVINNVHTPEDIHLVYHDETALKELHIVDLRQPHSYPCPTMYKEPIFRELMINGRHARAGLIIIGNAGQLFGRGSRFRLPPWARCNMDYTLYTFRKQDNRDWRPPIIPIFDRFNERLVGRFSAAVHSPKNYNYNRPYSLYNFWRYKAEHVACLAAKLPYTVVSKVVKVYLGGRPARM